MTEKLFDFGNVELLQNNLGLTPLVGLNIATIITFSSAIEYHLERAIWRLRELAPKGINPVTDAKGISQLTEMLEAEAKSLTVENSRNLLETWCTGARSGFKIRNNIAHGVPLKLGDTLTYARNSRWYGEQRKRDFGSFWADDNTMALVNAAMASLLRIIVELANENTVILELATPEALNILRTSKSILGEFASETYNPSYEKY